MPYLTKITLDPRHPDVWRALGDSHALHRLVYAGFPDAEEGGAGRPLYRLDLPLPRAEGPVLLVQSSESPAHPERWLGKPYVALEGPKELDLAFLQPGQTFRFRLHANPTRRFVNLVQQDVPGRPARVECLSRERLAANGKTRREGKRMGLYREAEQLEWLQGKALAAGFELVEVQIAPTKSTESVRATELGERIKPQDGAGTPRNGNTNHLSSRKHSLKHVSVTFEGVLRVTRPDQLREAVEQGIGTAKGFGFGLLSLAPVR